MSLHLTSRFLTDRRRGLIGWLVGLSIYTALIVSFYPWIEDSDGYQAAIDDYPEAFKEFLGGDALFNINTGPGFVNVQIFTLVLPLLLAVVGIGYGAAHGNEEKSGLVDLMLAHPVTRGRLVLERALAVVAAVSLVGAVSAVTILAAGLFIDLGINAGNLAAATVATVLLVAFHGCLALAVAVATGERSLAVGVATVVLAAGYLLHSLGGVVAWLEPYRVVSPYYHAVDHAPLFEGWAWSHLGILATLTVAAVIAAVWLFNRRDVA